MSHPWMGCKEVDFFEEVSHQVHFSHHIFPLDPFLCLPLLPGYCELRGQPCAPSHEVLISHALKPNIDWKLRIHADQRESECFLCWQAHSQALSQWLKWIQPLFVKWCLCLEMITQDLGLGRHLVLGASRSELFVLPQCCRLEPRARWCWQFLQSSFSRCLLLHRAWGWKLGGVSKAQTSLSPPEKCGQKMPSIKKDEGIFVFGFGLVFYFFIFLVSRMELLNG